MSTESNVIAPGQPALRRSGRSSRETATTGASTGTTERAGLGLAAVGVLVFSFSVPMTKVAVRGIDPLLAAAGRAAVAGVLAAVVLAAGRSSWPTRREVVPLIAVAGGVVFGFPVLTAYALRHVPSSHGAVVSGLLPLATAGCAVLRARERPTLAYWLCSLVGLGAVVAFVAGRDGWVVRPAHLLLLLAIAAAAVGYAEGAILARTRRAGEVICWALVLSLPATIGLSAWSAASHPVTDATVGQWLAFAYTAVCSMFLGFFAWYAGLARAGIARAGQLQLAQPALGLLWAWPLVGERPTAAAVVTVVVVLTSVAAGRRTAVHPAVRPAVRQLPPPDRDQR